jgi:CRISPR-associated protein Csh1
MLSTLLKIGQWQSHGKSEWDRFLEFPKVESTDKNGNEIKNYVLPILLDLDLNEVLVDDKNLYAYDENQNLKLKTLKILGRRNKAFYVTSIPGKFIQVFKSLFGKPSGDIEGDMIYGGELISIIENNYHVLTDGYLFRLAKEIYNLKSKMEAVLLNETGEVKLSEIGKMVKLQPNEKIILMTIMVKSELFELKEPKFLAEIDEYIEFLKYKYELDEFDENATEHNTNNKSLCYVHNKFMPDVSELNLSTSFSMNKMFVTTTQNYLNGFNKNQNAKNYQVSLDGQKALDVGSNYVLKNLKVDIANINHVVIPQFMENEEIDLDLAIKSIISKTDVLFNLRKLKAFSDGIKDESKNPYWLNFLAYDTNGNFFKSTELIKDVSNFYFQKILHVFFETDTDFRENETIDWHSIMTSFSDNGALEKGWFFNFNTIYQLIPIRKDKNNKALALMKSILENRHLERKLLYSFYCELILCYYYERYKSYPNIHKSSKDYFSLNIRNSTYKYLAFFEVLKKLNLIDMNEETHVNPAETGNKYDESIKDFFEKMKLSLPQQAMFYLGRMLNTVEFIQKGKKKTVIDKVNFNGMDRDDIQRLRLSLIEKAKQYSKVGKVIFTDNKFGNLFDYNQWNMNPQEAVFFLMTGYSFGISAKDAKELENAETEEIES